jgi:hypothetical protein
LMIPANENQIKKVPKPRKTRIPYLKKTLAFGWW